MPRTARAVHAIAAALGSGAIALASPPSLEPLFPPAALAFLEALCRERGAALADFYCSADPIGHGFWSHGWFSAVDDFYLQVPNWFYPIDMRTPPTTSLILWARDDVGSLLDRSRVFITKGDCDMDRPTLRYLEEHGIAV